MASTMEVCERSNATPLLPRRQISAEKCHEDVADLDKLVQRVAARSGCPELVAVARQHSGARAQATIERQPGLGIKPEDLSPSATVGAHGVEGGAAARGPRSHCNCSPAGFRRHPEHAPTFPSSSRIPPPGSSTGGRRAGVAQAEGEGARAGSVARPSQRHSGSGARRRFLDGGRALGSTAFGPGTVCFRTRHRQCLRRRRAHLQARRASAGGAAAQRSNGRDVQHGGAGACARGQGAATARGEAGPASPGCASAREPPAAKPAAAAGWPLRRLCASAGPKATGSNDECSAAAPVDREHRLRGGRCDLPLISRSRRPSTPDPPLTISP